jgi:hypothetical protein
MEADRLINAANDSFHLARDFIAGGRLLHACRRRMCLEIDATSSPCSETASSPARAAALDGIVSGCHMTSCRLHRGHSNLGDALDFLHAGGNFRGLLAGVLGQFPNFIGHHGKPRPVSPARAASMAAFRASRLV